MTIGEQYGSNYLDLYQLLSIAFVDVFVLLQVRLQVLELRLQRADFPRKMRILRRC